VLLGGAEGPGSSRRQLDKYSSGRPDRPSTRLMVETIGRILPYYDEFVLIAFGSLEIQ
jgi:hypothetical protein